MRTPTIWRSIQRGTQPWRRRALRAAPEGIRKPIEILAVIVSAGVLKAPGELLARLRHRQQLERVNRALFYHRFATTLVLCRELGVLASLADAPATSDELASRLRLHPRATEQLLRVAEATGAVERRGAHEPQRYALSPFARAYLLPAALDSFGPMLDLLGTQSLSFEDVVSGIRDGSVPPRFDIFSDRARYHAFLDAVNGYLFWASHDLLNRADLPPVERFIVGSMGVSFSAALLSRFPEAKVTYGCLEHLVREVPRLRERYQVRPGSVAGTHAHGGDPFADVWGSEDFDLVFLTKKMILDPEQRIGERFARKAFEVLRPGGVLILWESVHEEDGPTPVWRAMEALMDLSASPAGAVLTFSRLEETLGRIGFEDIELVPCMADTTTFVLAYKPRSETA